MRFTYIYKILRNKIKQNKIFFFFIFLGVLAEVGVSLIMPQMISEVIDGLETEKYKWLVGVTTLYCLIVVCRGSISVWNTYISEKIGWKLCDYLRGDMFEHVFQYSVQQHKNLKTGFLLERIEGDINVLVGFLSNMFIDIISSLLMVLGILMFFYRKSLVLGVFFSVISVIIILLFYKTQDAIALLWKETREEETEVLGEFSQDVMARQDILGMNKGNFVIDLFNIKFKKYAGKHIRASFLGNIPSTLFFSLLNVGEGVVLIIGIIMMMQDKMTIGEVYILLSYVGLLNMPFYSLKYEFAQMPKVLAAIERINDVYSENSEVECNEKLLCWESEGTIEFDGVTFGYNSENLVLNDVNFQINNGENVIIEGRTGSGKSTILQLIAGFYKPDKGQVKIGGYDVRSYNEENYYSRLCYIMQFNVIIEDTIRNNVTRFNENFSDEEIYQALKTVNLFEWIRKECDNGLDTIINARSISQDRALLLVWAGVLLANPKVLLVDECDSNIQDNTIKIIDDIINSQLDKTTIVIVTHKRRNSIKVHKEIKIETGRIINVIDSNFALE